MLQREKFILLEFNQETARKHMVVLRHMFSRSFLVVLAGAPSDVLATLMTTPTKDKRMYPFRHQTNFFLNILQYYVQLNQLSTNYICN